MAVIKGNLVDKFVDQKIEVSVILNNSYPESIEANKGKQPPSLLFNTSKIDGNKYIGNAVICQEGSHISFIIHTTTPPLAGIKPIVRTQQEIIFDGMNCLLEKRYERNVTTQVDTYQRMNDSNHLNAKTILVNDFAEYSREEGSKRSNVEIVVQEINSYKKGKESYPKAGIDGDVKPGSLEAGKKVDFQYGESVTIETGENEMGAMKLAFFILKDDKAIKDFAEKLQGITPNDDW